MLKHTLIIVALTLTMVLVLEPMQTVHGVMMTHAERVALAAADADAKNQTKLENGGGFVKALGEPFRAIGRLFGGGNKKKTRVEGISEKDIKKFESVKATPDTQKQTEPAKGMLVSQPSSLVKQTDKTRLIPITPTSLASLRLEKGRGLLNARDLNAASAELSAAVSLDPKLAEASSLLGVAYWHKGLRGQAQNSFE